MLYASELKHLGDTVANSWQFLNKNAEIKVRTSERLTCFFSVNLCILTWKFIEINSPLRAASRGQSRNCVFSTTNMDWALFFRPPGNFGPTINQNLILLHTMLHSGPDDKPTDVQQKRQPQQTQQITICGVQQRTVQQIHTKKYKFTLPGEITNQGRIKC